MNTPTGTELLVCQDITRRQQMGINKYGTTVEMNPIELRAWICHLYEELTDAAIYTKRIIQELEKQAENQQENGR